MKKHKTRKQKLQQRKHRGYKPYGVRMKESTTPTRDRLYLKSELRLVENEEQPKGREWEVTIIGAESADDVVTVEGKQFIKSLNGRLYDIEAIETSTPHWEGVKVYDDHLTDEEFQKRQGMRSTVAEWLGTLVNPFFESSPLPKLKATYKVIDKVVREKLLEAWEAGVLKTIGLSIDTFPLVTGEAVVEGKPMQVIGGFDKILSVDQVANPAAGGRIERLIAANTQQGANDTMNEEQMKELVEKFLSSDEFKTNIGSIVQTTMAEALAADIEEETEQEAEDVVNEETTQEADTEETTEENGQEAVEAAEEAEEVIELEVEVEPVSVSEQAANDAVRRLECRVMLNERLLEAKLPANLRQMIKDSFDGRIFESADLEKMIRHAKKIQASGEKAGRMTETNRSTIEVGIDAEDKFRVELMRIIMGDNAFRALEQSDDDHVQERLRESAEYQAWKNHSKPNTGRYGKMSHLLYEYFGGDLMLNGRAYEAASTSSLTTVVKNTVNIMTAADYSVRERWWEPLVITEEVDTIDQATLARLYGASTLDVVNEGAAYTELTLSDEEETATFVKKGNYVGITLETMLRDKVNFIRRIPRTLNNAWYNTISALASGVFTVNSGAGAVLSDTGALFNATGVTTAGGHANLLTTALSYSAFSAARNAMRDQTDQPLGAGRRLLINPKYLLVPIELENTAIQIRNSELVPEADGAGTTGNQSINAFQGQFEVVVVPDWTDANDWALVGDPRQYPAIYLIHPRGQRTPQLFTADNETSGAMFTNDTMRFKIRQMLYRQSDTYDALPVSDFRPLFKNNVA